jgi:osmotically inducible protein OsmC
MLKRRANAQWEGTLTKGRGRMSVDSGLFQGEYSFGSRFEEARGTNPEELIGAALAGCFSMAFSGELEQAGYPPRSIRTEATVSLDKGQSGFSIVAIELDTQAAVPGIDESRFAELGQKAKKGCPVSRALSESVRVTLKARLVPSGE